MAELIPEKAYFRIGEVSKILGVAPHVIRYWETEFKTIRPRRAKSDQRLYRKKDVEELLLIKKLLYEEKFTISGAKKRLAEWREKQKFLLLIRQKLVEIKEILDKR